MFYLWQCADGPLEVYDETLCNGVFGSADSREDWNSGDYLRILSSSKSTLVRLRLIHILESYLDDRVIDLSNYLYTKIQYRSNISGL